MKILKVFGAVLVFSLIFIPGAFAQLNKVPNLKLYDFDRLHFGFILAANEMDFVVETKEDLYLEYFTDLPGDGELLAASAARINGIRANPSLGFAVGIVGDMRLGEYFNLRFIPSLTFGKRSLDYYVRLYDENDVFKTEKLITKKINSTFLEFPLLLKYKSKRVHNIRGYVFGGVKFSFDLASEARKKEQNNYDVKLYGTDTYGTLGAGFDVYMNWFKFGVELSMSYGTRDMLLREDNLYTDSIESLRSKIFLLTFTFE